jgi:riboflavin kinase / FMN adenylyltransferase
VEVVHDPASFTPSREGTAVTIGAYDGVHLGHRAVIAEVCRLASARRLSPVVVTFDRHPASVVRPGSAPMLLTDLQQKVELLESTGVDATVVVRFDEARSLEPAEEFVEDVLVRALAARLVVVGEDFHFGHRRRGDVALLERMGAERGFEVVGIRLLPVEGAGLDGPVSSTAIRQALLAGDVDLATRLLGRPHEVRGVVVQGDQRGRELGFPTANIAVAGDILLPGDGVYAGWHVRGDGDAHPAVISLGWRPQFYDKPEARLLETYLLDFDGDLYREPAGVRFARHLRGQDRFDSVDALVEQMQRDADAARALLA